MACEGTKREDNFIFSIFFGWNVQWRIDFENGGFLERKSNFSLDFLSFGPSVLVGPRSKVVLRGKGYAWAPILGSFHNSDR